MYSVWDRKATSRDPGVGYTGTLRLPAINLDEDWEGQEEVEGWGL